MKLFKYKQFIRESVSYIEDYIDGAKKDYPQDIRNLEKLREDFYSEIIERCIVSY